MILFIASEGKVLGDLPIFKSVPVAMEEWKSYLKKNIRVSPLLFITRTKFSLKHADTLEMYAITDEFETRTEVFRKTTVEK